MSQRLVDAPYLVLPRRRGLVLRAPSGPLRLATLGDFFRAFGFMPPLAGGALLAPQPAEDVMLQNILNKTAPQTLKMKLYTSNTTPGETDTEATYTEMGAVQGYVEVSLTPGSWTITPGNPTSAAYPQITWTFTAGGPTSVYGYYVVQTTSGKIMWAERFSGAPFVVQNNGDQIQITPQITLE